MNVVGDVQADLPDHRRHYRYGRTLVKTVDALYAAGAASVYACASHAVLSGPAIDRIANSRLEQLVVTNTIPLREAAQKLTVASAEGGQKLRRSRFFRCGPVRRSDREHSHGTSVSTLFS